MTPQASSVQPPSDYAAQVVSTLARTDLGSGELTSEMQAAWKEALDKLAGEPGAVRTLAGTLAPDEIERLLKNMEQLAPGQFTQILTETAGTRLASAAAGGVGKDDLGALFRILQEHGGASEALLLESLTGQYKYYSTIALANLPDGAGIPVLIRMAQDPSPTGIANRNAAVQALAQVAPASPEAMAVLLQMAQAGQISHPNWITISSVLGGHKFQIGTIPPDPATGKRPVGNYRSWHLTYGNQNFYSAPVTVGWTEERINERVALIDQLTAVTTDPTGHALLERSRTELLNRVESETPPPGQPQEVK